MSLSTLLESPSCPFQFSPQHITFRSTVIAHVWNDPAETLSAPVPPSEEYAGICRSVVVPSPICPLAFRPQHFTLLSVSTAQVCDSPDETPIADTPEPRSTVIGVVLSMVVPSPSCPNEFEPQQRIDPSSSSVQVWYDPAEISIAFLPIGIEAFCGSRLESLVPSPSCPLSFIPQQLTEPSSSMAHEW